MPPKRPLEENPPSASASDEESEEEEEGSEEEQEAPKPIQSSTKSIPPKPPSSSDDEDDDGDDEEEEEEDVEAQKAKPTADHDNEEEGDDDDDSESGSGSGSESDNEPVKHMIAPRTAEVKPISSKPMSDIPKSKKLPSANTAPAKPKRPSEEENDKKRKKKKVADIEDGGDEDIQKKGAAGEEKKQLFQRVWTNEDEIILFNSLKDFKREGHNAANDMAGFHAFVKDSLHIDVTKAQLANKIQRLEKKFRNNASRSKEPGKDPVISKPHEWKSYQLSKEIWGDQSGKDNGAETNNAGVEGVEVGVTERKRKRTQGKNNGVASPKGKVAKPVKSPKVEHMEEENKEDNAREEDGAGGTPEYPYLNQYMQILNHPVLPVPPQGLVGLFGKKGWDLIGTSKAKAFDQKWKALLIVETKAYLERLDVVRDQTKSMLEVLESSDV